MERKPISIFHKASPEDREIFTTVGMRTNAADRIIRESSNYEALQAMTHEEWLAMDEETYQELEKSARDMFETTRTLRADAGDNEGVSAMSVNFDDIVRHIRVMQFTLEDLWSQGLQSAFPEGTSFSYVKWLCLSHDYYRFANINGPLPLDYVDRVSDGKLTKLFPNSPAREHLHTMAMITGIEPLPTEDNVVPYIMKLVDTTGKATPRFPDEFFSENGPYEAWVNRQVEKGSLPFHAVQPNMSRDERFRYVSTEEYKDKDVQLTLKGLEKLQEVIPGVNYNAALKRAASQVASNRSIVADFGRGFDVNQLNQYQFAA